VGGRFDLDAGVLYRRPQDAIETNKRGMPLPIPDRLMPHLRRWRRRSMQYVIEYDGKPINSQLRPAWAGAREMAGSARRPRRHLRRLGGNAWAKPGFALARVASGQVMIAETQAGSAGGVRSTKRGAVRRRAAQRSLALMPSSTGMVGGKTTFLRHGGSRAAAFGIDGSAAAVMLIISGLLLFH
jgi:hypothetical protein